MIRRGTAGLAVLLVLAGCASTTPTPSVLPSPSALPTPTPPPVTTSIEIDAEGRYLCDFAAGCAPFVEITTVGDPYAEDDLTGWDPPPTIVLPQTAADDDVRIFEVGSPTAPVDPLPSGSYLILAGALWVDDEGTMGPQGPNANLTTGEFGVCRAPLEIDDDTGEASIAVTFHEDEMCELEIHTGVGARLDVEMEGEVQCTTFPYSCAAYLSVLPPGTVVESAWRPAEHDPWWGADEIGATQLGDTPVFAVPALPVGRHRLLISLLGRSDVVSYTPEGEIASDLLSRCYLDVDVGPDTKQVSITVTLTSGLSQWSGACRIERT